MKALNLARQMLFINSVTNIISYQNTNNYLKCLNRYWDIVIDHGVRVCDTDIRDISRTLAP